MKLDLKTLQEITFGAERIEEKDGALLFRRFTEAEDEAYASHRIDAMVVRTYSTAGVRLSFKTDSEYIKIKCKMSDGSSRPYAYFDLYENGVMTGHEGSDEYDNEACTYEFRLKGDVEHVEVYFPWSVRVDVEGVELSDGALVEPVARQKRAVFYGDSITQGYDSKHPSLSYANIISRLLDADSIDKGVGGEIFFPDLVDDGAAGDADFVFVAYGTNDWNSCTKETFISNCEGFIGRVARKFPTSKIYVITPIWRVDKDAVSERMGVGFKELAELIESAARPHENITVIKGISLVPHLPDFYHDKRVHPNDTGFGIYAESLWREIMKSGN